MVWHDLMSTDPDASKAFYAALFGWDIQDVPMPHGTYRMITAGGEGQGGIEIAVDGRVVWARVEVRQVPAHPGRQAARCGLRRRAPPRKTASTTRAASGSNSANRSRASSRLKTSTAFPSLTSSSTGISQRSASPPRFKAFLPR